MEARKRGRPLKPNMKSIGMRLNQELIEKFYHESDRQGIQYGTMLENLIKLMLVVEKKLEEDNAHFESEFVGRKKIKWTDLI